MGVTNSNKVISTDRIACNGSFRVTLALTAVFACQAVRGEVSQDFMMIYTTVIAFYFGTQAQKLQSGAETRHDDGASE